MFANSAEQQLNASTQAEIVSALQSLSSELAQLKQQQHQQHQQQQQQRLEAFEAIMEENMRLKATITALQAEISALKAPTPAAPATVTSKVIQSREIDTGHSLPTVKDSSWATVAKKHIPAPSKRPQTSARCVAAASCAFTIQE
ncbi:hypothetical protein BDF14DRAFT_1887205, partial [Spinellus fusiger]